jgi:hypothetical protein
MALLESAKRRRSPHLIIVSIVSSRWLAAMPRAAELTGCLEIVPGNLTGVCDKRCQRLSHGGQTRSRPVLFLLKREEVPGHQFRRLRPSTSMAALGCPASITSFLFLRYFQPGFKVGAESLHQDRMISIIA